MQCSSVCRTRARRRHSARAAALPVRHFFATETLTIPQPQRFPLVIRQFHHAVHQHAAARFVVVAVAILFGRQLFDQLFGKRRRRVLLAITNVGEHFKPRDRTEPPHELVIRRRLGELKTGEFLPRHQAGRLHHLVNRFGIERHQRGDKPTEPAVVPGHQQDKRIGGEGVLRQGSCGFRGCKTLRFANKTQRPKIPADDAGNWRF